MSPITHVREKAVELLRAEHEGDLYAAGAAQG